MAERSSGLLRLSRSTRAVRSRPGLEPPSLKSITVWPSWSRSPECKSAWSMSWPLTNVPLAEPRSTIRYASSSCRSSACRRETSVSWSRIAFELSRPRATGLDLNSNRLPWSAPWMTNKEATRLSLLAHRRYPRGCKTCQTNINGCTARASTGGGRGRIRPWPAGQSVARAGEGSGVDPQVGVPPVRTCANPSRSREKPWSEFPALSMIPRSMRLKKGDFSADLTVSRIELLVTSQKYREEWHGSW